MSKRIKRKMMRSGYRECPTCSEKRPLIEHHLNGRECPDWDKPWNKAWICSNCHDDIHIGGELTIEGWVSTTSGKELSWYRKGETKPDFRPDIEAPTYS